MNFEARLTLILEGKETHDYSSTQINLPRKISREIIDYAKTIDQDDLHEKGIEDEPHVTVKYGLHIEEPDDDLLEALEGQGEVTLTLGKMSAFKTEDRDVLKIEVDSPDLHRLNKKIKKAVKCTDTFPKYVPHVTVAYLKPGKSEKYLSDRFKGKKITVDTITFSSKTREKSNLKLGKRLQTA
jgi:2'-5' RNA ligase